MALAISLPGEPLARWPAHPDLRIGDGRRAELQRSALEHIGLEALEQRHRCRREEAAGRRKAHRPIAACWLWARSVLSIINTGARGLNTEFTEKIRGGAVGWASWPRR
jgi:hypothetical protein